MARSRMVVVVLSAVIACAAMHADAALVSNSTTGMTFGSIQAAIDDVTTLAGHTILVGPDTYFESLMLSKAVTLDSIAGPGATIINATGLGGPVVSITAGATLNGFTLTGAGGTTTNVGGVRIDTTTAATVSNNVIVDNHPADDSGIPAGGILVTPSSSATIRNNDIKGNTSLSIGGIMVHAGGDVDIINNFIRGNGGALPLGGATITGGLLYGASGLIVNNQITGNRGSGIGGFYYAGGMSSTVEVINNTIYGNYADTIVPPGASSVGGLFLDDGGDITVTNTIIHSNFGSLPFTDLVGSADFFVPGGGVLSLSYSHVGTIAPGLPPGMFMVLGVMDPMFVGPTFATMAGPTDAGDYTLMTGSPNIGTGLSSAFPLALPSVDLAGDPRFVGVIDIGAFELQPAQTPSPGSSGVPEPTTVALAMMGLIVASCRRRAA